MVAAVLVFLFLTLVAGAAIAVAVFINVAFGPRPELIGPKKIVQKRVIMEQASEIHVDPEDATSPTWGELVSEYLTSHSQGRELKGLKQLKV